MPPLVVGLEFYIMPIFFFFFFFIFFFHWDYCCSTFLSAWAKKDSFVGTAVAK